MDKRYITAFLHPPKFTIEGIEMDYFCPRHYVTLQAINSPFLNPNAKGLKYKDLFIAMRICSTNDWVESIQMPNWRQRIKYIMLEAIYKRQSNAFVEFGRYISESMSVPKVWVKNQDGEHSPKPTNIPETLSMVTLLMTKFGFSEKDAWNMPFSKAIWYSTAYAAQEGSEISIITTEQEEKEDRELKMLERFEKKMKESVDAAKKKGGVK